MLKMINFKRDLVIENHLQSVSKFDSYIEEIIHLKEPKAIAIGY
jgi:hypothetical protein